MRRYKITIAYDGTDYAGWQVQPDGRGICNVLQDTYARVFKQNVIIKGASRTDAGVHALGQVAAFDTDLPLEPERIKKIWNDSLPLSINIANIEQVSAKFNPRYDVTSKTYWYHFFLQRPSPFLQRFGYYFPYTLDLDLFKQALAIFVGTHNFSSFSSAQEYQDPCRTIDSIYLDFDTDFLSTYRIVVQGRSFSRFMIRRIVGACFDVACKQLSLDVLKKALANPDPRQTFYNAPAQGLLLYKIEYK